MRTIIITTFLLLCSFSCAQTLENPAFSRSDVPAFHITKVKITEDTTYIFCSYYAEEGSWASISKETFLRDSKSHKIFPLLRCEGLPYSPETRTFSQNESCELLFSFPSIVGTEQFDFIESEGERAFNIYDISLNKQFKTSYSNEELEQISEMVSAYNSSGDSEKIMLLKDCATSLNNLASCYLSQGNFEEAIRLGTVEVEIRGKVFGDEDQSYIEALANLADCNAILGNYVEAIRLGMEEINTRKRVYGTENPEYINSLEKIATYYHENGDIVGAIRIQQEVTDLKKKVLGIEHVDYASSLTWLAEYYYEHNNYGEAIRIGTEAMEIYKKVFGIESPDYTMSLSSLALFYYMSGNFKIAVQLQTEVTDLSKKVYGSGHLNYGISLGRLADYNSELLNYDEALKHGTKALEIFKRSLDMEHPYYARSLGRLARYYSKKGNYSEALRLGIEAINIWKHISYTDNPEYANLLNNLAGYNLDLGNYSETIRLMTEAKDIYERVFGKENLNYAISLNNLADYNYHVGNYTEAIRLVTEAIEIYKKNSGTEHPEYANSLNNLANYYSSVGNYSEAIKLVTEAIEINKRIFGTGHPKYAESLNNLALIYSKAKVGNFSEALRLETEVMEITKKSLGTEHPEYARSLNNLAILYSYYGNYPEAIRLETEAKEIRKRILGMDHPFYATSLHNLASIYSALKNYHDAIRLETEAKEIFKRNLGTDHPYYATSLLHLWGYYKNLNNYIDAFNYLQQFLSISQSFILQNFTEMSSHIKETLWTNEYANWYYVSLPNMVLKYQTKQSVSELYDKTCLFAKGILLNTSIEMRNLILESGDSVIIEKYNVLSLNINNYNKLLEKPIKERFMNADSLKSVIEQQEMELARESKSFGDYTHNLKISWKDVQKGLKDSDIAIEFLDFPESNTDSTLYVALTLRKNYESPHLVILFQENQLKEISEDVYYTRNDVSNLVWKPLEEELHGVRNIYFVPSGELHRIGIEYLPVSKTENINDVYTLHRLSSTRQLAIIHDKTKGKKNILYGGINYDEKTNTFKIDSSFTKESVYRSIFTYRVNVDSLSLRNSYEYLEGTKKEADMIANDMKRHSVPYIYYSGTDGTEESFKNLDGTKPKVIHIATHGFYFSEEESGKSILNQPEMELLTEEGSKERQYVENKPMTRSGLLFSGCNRFICHEQIPEGEEDGILTAQEISTLDLRGLDLVVLSACQTGLGDIISGEGVFGLQRGFKKAGAKTIVMSLWNVNDESTMKMMTCFYHHYLGGMSKEEAFHAAQDELRKDSPSRQERPDWASFIMLDGFN